MLNCDVRIIRLSRWRWWGRSDTLVRIVHAQHATLTVRPRTDLLFLSRRERVGLPVGLLVGLPRGPKIEARGYVHLCTLAVSPL